jgi:hypothetical protein
MEKKLALAFPQLGFVIVTRAALGAGLGLLAASRFSRRERRRLGILLVSIGAITTIPALFILRRARRPEEESAAA